MYKKTGTFCPAYRIKNDKILYCLFFQTPREKCHFRLHLILNIIW